VTLAVWWKIKAKPCVINIIIETVLTKREWPVETCVRPFEPLDRVHKGGCQGIFGQKDFLDSTIEAHIFFSNFVFVLRKSM